MNKILLFLTNACGNADCISSHEGHLCEECYKISKFCDDCRTHLVNVLDMSNYRFFILLFVFALLFGAVGFVLGLMHNRDLI